MKLLKISCYRYQRDPHWVVDDLAAILRQHALLIMKDGSKYFFTTFITPPVEARITSYIMDLYIDFTSMDGKRRQGGGEPGSRKLLVGLQQIMLRGGKYNSVKKVKYDTPSTCLRISSKNSQTMFALISTMEEKNGGLKMEYHYSCFLAVLNKSTEGSH